VKIRRLQIDGCQFCVGDLNPGGITPSVQFRLDFQTGLRGGVGDQLDYDFVTDQRPTSPVLGNVVEHPMFNLVPFAGSGWEMADVDRNTQVKGEVLQGDLPQTTPATVAAAPSAVINRFRASR
jgi:hypothetical protein